MEFVRRYAVDNKQTIDTYQINDSFEDQLDDIENFAKEMFSVKSNTNLHTKSQLIHPPVWQTNY